MKDPVSCKGAIIFIDGRAVFFSAGYLLFSIARGSL